MHSAIDTAARRCAVLVATGLLLPLAACSSSDDGGSGKAGGDIAVAARADVVEGGTLHWAVDAAPTTLNTFRTDAGQATSRIAGATLPALFTLDARGRPQLNEDYLVSAHVTSNAPQKVVYQLADDARWNNGRAIGVRDFVAQWKALNGRGAHASEFDAARNAGYDRIASVRRGDGPRQVEVTFREPYADWQALFTPLYPAEVMSKPKAFAADPEKGLPVSAGPFKLGKRSHDGESVTLVRDAKWWGDKAKLDRILLLAVPRGEREQALKRGRLDLARVNRSTAGHIGSAQQLQGKNGEHAGRKGKESTAGLSPYVVRKTLAPAYTQLALNGASGPLTDERVRRAVARAVDRSKLAHDALDGLGLPTTPIGSHLRVSTQAGYHDNSDALGGPDVKSAEALLAEAGWKPGGSTAPEGDTVEAKPGGSDDGKHGRAGHTEKKSSRSARRDDLALRITPAEAARIGASPLSLTPFTAEQRAGLLGQAAAAGKRAAAQEDSSHAHKAAEAAEKRARAARARADELNLLSSGRATLVRTKNGKPLSLRFVLPKGAEAEQLRSTGERIVRMLNKVGVRTRVETVDSDDYFRTIAAGKYDLALYAWPVSAFPATDAQPIFAKPSPAAGGALAVQQNYTRVGTDQIDQLFRQASRELDDSKRQDLLRQADAHIWAIAGSVPLYQLPQLVAARHTLANAGAFGLRTPDYADIGFTKDGGIG